MEVFGCGGCEIGGILKLFKDDKLEEAMEVLAKEKGNLFLAADIMQVKPATMKRYRSEAIKRGIKAPNLLHDADLISCNISIADSLQKSRDMERIKNKGYRGQARYTNAVSEYGSKIVEMLDKHASVISSYEFSPLAVGDGKRIGVIQVTDNHLNELVDMPGNKFDFKIAAKRLKKFIAEATRVLLAQGVVKVLVAFTGDLLNSDRRLDELLSQSTNRAKATVLAVDLYKHMLLDIAHTFQKVEVVSVLGNEGRADQEMAFSDEVLSNNYDFTIVAMLKRLMAGVDNINFISYNTVETIIQIGDDEKTWSMNLHLSHDFAGQSNQQKATQATVGRIALESGEIVDYALCGHIHTTMNGDFVSRGSSLVGSNAYAAKKLNLAGKAGQNILVIGEDFVMPILIDLQTANNEGYPIEAELEAYNAKSVSKTVEKRTILEIVSI